MSAALLHERMNVIVEMPKEEGSAVVLSFRIAGEPALAQGIEAGAVEYDSWGAGAREYDSWSKPGG